MHEIHILKHQRMKNTVVVCFQVVETKFFFKKPFLTAVMNDTSYESQADFHWDEQFFFKPRTLYDDGGNFQDLHALI